MQKQSPPAESPAEDFETLVRTAHELADISGPVILKHFRKATPVENKAGKGAFDPVTKADRGAEKVIVEALATRFPDHGVYGEEFGIKPSNGPFRWVIDPIDGTRAFIMGSPLWGTLIGLLRDDKPYFGLMDQPFTRERFWSGDRATYHSVGGGRPMRLKTRECPRIEDATLTSTHPELFEGETRVAIWNEMTSRARLTRYGGDCYGYCLLAAGHVDIIVESGLKPYDIVALIPIIERAGGRVTTWTGDDAANGGDIIATGDARLHDAALAMIAKA
ncbi:histidinol-phosphatase [Hyphomicrobium methylovorum]|uniref:histidinol-phosphatase n=1 Tax=Hyphomicrobium methylovorum TaxID=84 RepID=UPI0015E726CA|nr:histidinol-phosphatase [Hyphomicrobium methylovorum]MBA2126804.1 histidinol-phosphatase [Hyphomicrobium methylovorum]